MAGSVFKRCSRCGRRVKQRTCSKCGTVSFSWAFVVDVGRDGNGDRIQQSRMGFASKKAAERALHELVTSLHQGTYVEASSVTLGEFLRDEWLPATAPPRVKFETWQDRRRNLETYVIPRLGDVPLQDLNAANLNRLYSELLRTGRVRKRGGLSPTSVRRIHSMLRKSLNDAVRWGRLSRNPTGRADPPSLRVVQASRRRSMNTWSEVDLRCFLDSTSEHDLHAMWVFAATTGVRRSELLGVRWSDLNLVARTAVIRQTVTPSEEGYRPGEDQKSFESWRTIHLDRRTCLVLQEHRVEQERLREMMGPGWQDNRLVFPQQDGSWWNPPAISLAFRRASDRAGVPRIRLHDLRHTHASLLLAAGVNPKVVSERLGHSSVAFTLDSYAHVMPGMQPDAAELFVELVYGPDEEVEAPVDEAPEAPDGEETDDGAPDDEAPDDGGEGA
jgi:integrase